MEHLLIEETGKGISSGGKSIVRVFFSTAILSLIDLFRFRPKFRKFPFAKRFRVLRDFQEIFQSV